MKIIPYEIRTGAENMQIDSDLLDEAIKNRLSEPVFRLYGWSPKCISLGRNQSDTFLDKEFLKKNNIDVVRRLTGGRALLHDKEVTYSYIAPINDINVVNSYKKVSQILVDIFSHLGIELEFPENKKISTKFDYCMLISTGADLCYKGRKFIGSAQFRKDGYMLQHGSILFDYDENLLSEIFHQEIDTSSLISLKEINPAIRYEDIHIYDNI